MAPRATMTVFHVTLWVSLLCVGLAWGQIYKWTDRRGQVHFTDNPSRIPPEYRTKATTSATSPSEAATVPTARSEGPANVPEALSAPPSQPPAPAAPRDRLGRGPEYWRNLARQWSTELQQHMAERDRLQLLYNYTHDLTSTTRDVWDRGRLAAEIERLAQALADIDRRIEQAQTMLQTTLPLEAVQAGANPEWLKELTPPPR